MTLSAQDDRETTGPRSGRHAQKRRTRRALLDAAAELVAEGTVPTVAQAAERADVSRATAYRYFPTQGSLIVHVSTPLDDLSRILEQADDEDVPHRVELIVRAIAAWCYDNRTVLFELTRAVAEVADEGADQERMRQRQYWIDEALLPVRDRLDASAYARLFGTLTLFVGPEPIVVMQTVSRLSRVDAIESLAWGAATLVRAQLTESGIH
jgi:AcrR family transcriptional regulator